MDGASGAFAAVPIAIQLAGGLKKISDFWKSVQNAPMDVQNIITDLDLLSGIFCEMAFEAQHNGPDATLEKVLHRCEVSCKALTAILYETQPGFVSVKRPVRHWTAVKTALRKEGFEKLQVILDRLKGTLIIVQQNLIRYEETILLSLVL